MEPSLGKIEKVDLREVWNHEALDFTKWLAKKENLLLLGGEIGIDIDPESVKIEAEVGDFNVDISAEEDSEERRGIVIENQLEQTNHDHLGKIITYASGHDAKIIIWVVEEAREEHQRAIEWLNENIGEDITFFLVSVELWRIGNSMPAPKFNIISQPNRWAEIIKEGSDNLEEPSETKLLQLDFWNKFKEYAGNNKTTLRFRRTRPQHWYNFALGSSKAHISLTVNTRDNTIGCEIYISKFKNLFFELQNKKETLEKELETKLDWQELKEGKASRIKLATLGDLRDKENWPNLFKWMQEWAEKFQKVFGKHIRESDLVAEL
ncbi:DUF4268 domain-containing protein [Candidatus Woesearchaeota archaeon]|nr:DUF4268 domain-containing protein [Candidatus Woesearchaeota archaeon]